MKTTMVAAFEEVIQMLPDFLVAMRTYDKMIYCNLIT